MSLWHWPEITPSIGCTWATGVLLQAATATVSTATLNARIMVLLRGDEGASVTPDVW
jgi:hypothetical protein